MEYFYRPLNHGLYPSYIGDDADYLKDGSMRSLWTHIAGGLLTIAALIVSHVGSASTAGVQRSATAATDVNGFRLGMTLAEINKLARLEQIGDFQYDAEANGIKYNFEVTPLGRVYRISSSQDLGDFGVDQAFIGTLRSHLVAKYGKPTEDTGETFDWELIQPATNRFGQTLPFRTMWMSAYIGGFSSKRTLEIKLIDFRILWADEAQRNARVRKSAEEKLAF